MLTGRAQQAIQVFNGFAPDENKPLIITQLYDFSSAGVIVDDWTVGQMGQTLPFVQSAFIDNGLNPNPLTVYFPHTDWTLRVPSLAQGVYSVYSSMPFTPKLMTVAGAGLLVKIVWANFMQPIGQWAAV